MNRTILKQAPSWAAALLLAAVFVWAAVPKILDPGTFGESINRYQLLPAAGVSLLAIYLPWLEFCAAVFLLWPRFRRSAAVLITLMLLMFLAAMASAVLRDLDISCGCFSRSGSPDTIGWVSFLRNTFLIVVSGFLIRPACNRS